MKDIFSIEVKVIVVIGPGYSPPPPEDQIFHDFARFFQKIWQNCMLVPLKGLCNPTVNLASAPGRNHSGFGENSMLNSVIAVADPRM